MNLDALYRYLTTFHPLPGDFRDALSVELRHAHFPKEHFLVQALSAAHHVYFLENGFAVSYEYRDGKRAVTRFWWAEEVIATPKSFFQQLPSDEIIALTADSEVFSLSHAAFERLSAQFPVVDKLARDITAEFLAARESWQMDMRTSDTWDCYQKLLELYPGIEQNVSQKEIASYLGVEPSWLSKVKRRHIR